MHDGILTTPQPNADLAPAETPSPAEIEAQLQKILQSAVFRGAPRHSRFLAFVVRKAVTCEAECIKEYPIGLAVFDRAADFDPAADPVVRSEARRLRSRLADYYEKLGKLDPVHIDLPKGTYVPVFSRNGVGAVPQQTASESLAGTPQKEPPRTGRKKMVLAMVLIGGIALCAVVAARFYSLMRKQPGHFDSRVAASPVKVRRSVAVLGFENLSRLPDKEWLSSALSEMITTEIGANGKLRTIPGEAVARARTELQLSPHDGLSKETLSRVEQNLDADLVVTGAYTILPAPNSRFDQVRVELCLQDAKTGEIIASHASAGSVADLFSLVDSAGSSLRRDLNVEPVSSDEVTQARAAAPSNMEAARLYAEGLTRLRNFDPLAARSLLQQSAAIDPNFPFVYLALADADDFLGEEASERSHVAKAYETSSHLSREQQLRIEARYEETQHHWDRAIATYRALVMFYPDNIDYGLRMARAEVKIGKGTDALHTLDQLRRLPAPLSADPRIDLVEAELRGQMGDFRQALLPVTRAAQNAKARGARLLYAHALLREAGLLLETNDARATQVDEEARSICAQLGDQACVATVYRRIGNTSVYIDPQGAEEAFRQAIRIVARIGNKTEEAGDLGGLAATLFAEGHYAEANRIYRQVLADARQQHNAFNIQISLNNLGEVELAQGHLAEAQKIEEEAVMVSQQSGLKVGMAYGLMDVAYILQLEGDFGGAEKHYSEAIELFRGRALKEQAVSQSRLAGIARDRGQLSEASNGYQQALALFSNHFGDDADIAYVRLGFAQVYIDQGSPAKGVSLAQQAVATFNRQKRPVDEGRARAVLAEAFLANGAIDEAAAEAKLAATLLSGSEARLSQAFVSVAAAHVAAVVDQKRNPQNLALDLHRLELAASQAESFKLVPLALEARLAKDAIEANTNRPGSLTQLKALESEARSRGLLLTASKAHAAAANTALYSASTGSGTRTH